MIIVDTNVIVDIIDADPVWLDWSDRALEDAGARDELRITHVILAELHARQSGGEVLSQRLSEFNFIVDPMTDAIAIRAGAAHRLYRSRGGERQAIIADFLIGAHAAVRRVPLITRDRQRFASYFPELTLITPEINP